MPTSIRQNADTIQINSATGNLILQSAAAIPISSQGDITLATTAGNVVINDDLDLNGNLVLGVNNNIVWGAGATRIEYDGADLLVAAQDVLVLDSQSISIEATNGAVAIQSNAAGGVSIGADTTVTLSAASGITLNSDTQLNGSLTLTGDVNLSLNQGIRWSADDYITFGGDVIVHSSDDFIVQAPNGDVNITCGGVLLLSPTSDTISCGNSFFQFVGGMQYRSGAADPTTSDIPSGYAADWRNTTTGIVRRWVNNNGVMESIQYT